MQAAPVSANQASTNAYLGALGKDEFLRLLIAQLRQQDPLQPVNDREFIAQLAQFSALEQMQNVAAAVEELARRQEVTAALGLVGRTVTVLDADGKQVTGAVEAVRSTRAGIALVVGGKEYSLASLVEVKA